VNVCMCTCVRVCVRVCEHAGGVYKYPACVRTCGYVCVYKYPACVRTCGYVCVYKYPCKKTPVSPALTALVCCSICPRLISYIGNTAQRINKHNPF
jgi:hypothetical protein